MAAPSQRTALGALFTLLATAFAGIAIASFRADEGVRTWVVGLAAITLAFWLAGLALRALRPH